MSGIAGVYDRDGKPAQRADLERMLLALTHRGPDGAELWQNECVGFVHRMLWTTPESQHESLPLAVRNGELAITADARIDNRSELIGALRLHDRPAGEIADSELILATYERWGQACPQHLLGDFAFAIWDARARTLFCARDHFGVKPFYLYASERLFAFASEIKGLLCLAEVPRRLNEARVADHVALLFDDLAATFYRDIVRLPPAHAMVVGVEGVRQWRYWQLDPERELQLGSDEAYAEAFREEFVRAVRCRTRSALPIGSMLSGGLDSSSIACVARDELKSDRPLHTFSLIFPNLPIEERRWLDERRFQQDVLATGGFEPHMVQADQFSPLNDVEQLHWHQDEAFSAPNLYLHWEMYRAANRNRVRVLLDGVDGDTAVSYGYERLTELARTWQWKTFAHEVRATSRKHLLRPWALALSSVQPLVPDFVVAGLGRLTVRRAAPLDALMFANASFMERIGLRQRVAVQTREARFESARRAHWRGLTMPLLSYALEVADKAAAAWSVEPRYPFFDRRLVELCLALPADQKLNNGWDRVVFRRAMEGILPRKVQWRPIKADLSPSFRRRLREGDQEMLERALGRTSIVENYINLSAVRAAHRQLAGSNLPDAQMLAIFNIANLSLWLQSAAVPA